MSLGRFMIVLSILVATACGSIGLSGRSLALAAPGSNSANAHLCQTQYPYLQGGDGSTFTSSDQCTAYAAHGGQLQYIPSSLTVTPGARTPGGTVDYFPISVTGSNLLPGSTVTLYDVRTDGAIYRTAQGTVQPDGTVQFSLSVLYCYNFSSFYAIGTSPSGQTVTSSVVPSPC